MKTPLRCLLLGAAGRDFHDAQRFFADEERFVLVGITATQIPYIDARSFPGEFIGYAQDVPIYPERDLPTLIKELSVDFVFLAYSDLSHLEVMHLASIVQANGAAFGMLGPKQTQLKSARPVVSVTAVRTGAGKSPITQAIAAHLRSRGLRAAALRHPMPYGNLRKQRVQRFASEADLRAHDCTVEEREEYMPYLEQGLVLWAGVDYAAILQAAEKESDVILWDGGNNDYSFVRPDLSVVVVDPLRPGHEELYYPGETNVRMADLVVATKVGSARPEDLAAVRERVARMNPNAQWIEADLELSVDHPERVKGKRVLVVEDGPTTTHGGMRYGAARLAAERFGAASLVDPRPHAVGSIAETLAKYPHLDCVLPALGYSEQQRKELEATIAASGADTILDGSPSRLDRVLSLTIPVARVSYRFAQRSGPSLFALVDALLQKQ